MRLNEQISEPEYLSKKSILVNRKADLRGKIAAFEQNQRNRLEPAIRFILEAKQATFLLSEGKPEGKRDFLKKIGSNFQVAEKSLTVELKKPWSYLADFNSEPSNTFAAGDQISLKSKWRREGDSNPRYDFWPYTGLANQRLQPLGHLSNQIFRRQLRLHAAFLRRIISQEFTPVASSFANLQTRLLLKT